MFPTVQFQIPPLLKKLLTDFIFNGKNVRRYTQKYNSATTFTSMSSNILFPPENVKY